MAEITSIHGVLLERHSTHYDYRGSIKTLYDDREHQSPFVQDKIAVSRRNVLRGLHGDYRVGKLISCLAGEAYLVCADARPESKTFGQWESWTVSRDNAISIYVPPGVLNGHLCLTDECLFWYKWSNYYEGPDTQLTIRWDDPHLAITWPISCPMLSPRDRLGDAFELRRFEEASVDKRFTPTVVAVSGYFNPIHSGHLNLIEEAKNLGETLIVIVNNDIQQALKGSRRCYTEAERLHIVRKLADVDKVVLSIDEDRTIARTLAAIRPKVHIFANGGDVTTANQQEAEVCERLGIEMVFGVGGGKVSSSSEIMARASNDNR